MNSIIHITLLGLKAEDRVTGFKGVVTSVSFDLYGCVQVVLTGAVDKDGKLKESHWFDVNRLNVLSDKPVMEVPNFSNGPAAAGKKGPAEKPIK